MITRDELIKENERLCQTINELVDTLNVMAPMLDRINQITGMLIVQNDKFNNDDIIKRAREIVFERENELEEIKRTNENA